MKIYIVKNCAKYTDATKYYVNRTWLDKALPHLIRHNKKFVSKPLEIWYGDEKTPLKLIESYN